MYNFLNISIPLFLMPKIIQVKLLDKTNPVGFIELFNGDGIHNNFVLSTIPTLDAFFCYQVGGAIVTGTYDSITNSVTLSSIPPIGTDNINIEWYDTGKFNLTLSDREENILSLLLVQCWAFKEQNFLLDIRRLLSDSDFHLGSEANSIRAKENWYTSIRENAMQEMKNYSWNVYTDVLNQKYGLT
jgi:hypothetical protein